MELKQYSCQSCDHMSHVDGIRDLDRCNYCADNQVQFNQSITMYPECMVCKNYNPQKPQEKVAVTKSQSNKIIDLIKTGTGIQLLMSDGKYKSILDSDLKYYLYPGNVHDFASPCATPPDQLPMSEGLKIAGGRLNDPIHVDKPSDLIKKIMSENKIDYCTDFDLFFWDIETVNFNSEENCVPTPEQRQSEIRMIQAIHQVKVIEDGQTSYKTQKWIWLNNHMNHTYKRQSGIKYVVCSNERQTVDEFFRLLFKVSRQTIVIGFNASASQLRKNKTALQISKSNMMNGYDLPWICARSGFRFSGQNQMTKAGNSRIFESTIRIQELPMCYFLDAQGIAHSHMSEKQSFKLSGYSLDDYASLYGIENKNQISHLQMKKAFSTYGSDITEYIDYGLQDVEVLV